MQFSNICMEYESISMDGSESGRDEFLRGSYEDKYLIATIRGFFSGRTGK